MEFVRRGTHVLCESFLLDIVKLRVSWKMNVSIHDPNMIRRFSMPKYTHDDHGDDSDQPTWRVLGGGVLIGEAHEKCKPCCRL